MGVGAIPYAAVMISAKAFYGDRFADVLAAHLTHGYVISGPGILCMGKPVPLSAPLEQMQNPYHTFDRGQCNAWWLHWIEGDMRSLVRLFPFELPFVAYERRCRLVIRRYDNVVSGRRELPASRVMLRAFAARLAPQGHP